MTTGNKLKRAYATAESLAGELKLFAQDTNNPEAKKMYTDLANTMEFAAGQLKERLDFVLEEEPQYREE